MLAIAFVAHQLRIADKNDSQCIVQNRDSTQNLKQINKKSLFPPRLELGTFRVLGERDNHYTTETPHYMGGQIYI
jgi:hypothetical protein